MNKIKNMANKVADWFRQLQVWLLITLRQMNAAIRTSSPSPSSSSL